MEVKGVAKNPLAIIALFISFMYGSASLILGISIDKLDQPSRWALVGFLVLFPMIIFGAFLFLVIKHHRKLYAPGDFRSDESFLAGVESVSFQSRIDDHESEEAGPADESELPVQEPDDATKATIAPSPGTTISQQARLAESLAGDLYQRRFGGLLKRNVRFVSASGRRFVFDFAIEVRDTVYVGEVKYTRTSAVKTALNSILGRFFLFDHASISEDVTFTKIATVVVEDREDFKMGSGPGPEIRRRLRELRSEVGVPGMIVEAYTMSELVTLVSSEGEKPGQ